MQAFRQRWRQLDGPDPGPCSPVLVVRARTRIAEFAQWLDEYWDDPELRSGFWRSGW
jgi:hypothetical protein